MTHEGNDACELWASPIYVLEVELAADEKTTAVSAFFVPTHDNDRRQRQAGLPLTRFERHPHRLRNRRRRRNKVHEFENSVAHCQCRHCPDRVDVLHRIFRQLSRCVPHLRRRHFVLCSLFLLPVFVGTSAAQRKLASSCSHTLVTGTR